MIALACDHHGVALKQELMKMLDEMGLAWKDFGTYDANNPGDDYPVYGYKAAQAVASGWTSLTESEWNRLARLARGIRTGTMVIFR